MTVGRGHQSIYFKDPQVIQDLEDLSGKDLDGKVSVSSVVCEVMKKALPEITKQVKKGKRTGIQISITVDL